MIYNYTTFCEFCEIEEEFISTTDVATCGQCGKETKVNLQEIIIQEQKFEITQGSKNEMQ